MRPLDGEWSSLQSAKSQHRWSILMHGGARGMSEVIRTLFLPRGNTFNTHFLIALSNQSGIKILGCLSVDHIRKQKNLKHVFKTHL